MKNLFTKIFEEIVLNKKYVGVLDKKLNKELLEDIVAFHSYSSNDIFYRHEGVRFEKNLMKIKGKNFAEDNNLEYMGELLERFKERNVIKNEKDLLTLVFTVSSLKSLMNLEIVDNQLEIYNQNIFKMIKEKPDAITLSNFISSLANDEDTFELLQSGDDRFFDTYYFKSLLMLKEMLKESNSLEETLLGLDCYITEVNELKYIIDRYKKPSKVILISKLNENLVSDVEDILVPALDIKPENIESNRIKCNGL